MIVPFSKSEINRNDIKLVSKILGSGWLTHGKYTNLFESEFTKYTSTKYADSLRPGMTVPCAV